MERCANDVQYESNMERYVNGSEYASRVERCAIQYEYNMERYVNNIEYKSQVERCVNGVQYESKPKWLEYFIVDMTKSCIEDESSKMNGRPRG